MRVAISIDRNRHGGTADLRCQSATVSPASRNSRRSVRRHIAYSAYLIQKLVIHGVAQFCNSHGIALTSAPALIAVELCVYAAATLLFLAIERPFLQFRKRLTPRKYGTNHSSPEP